MKLSFIILVLFLASEDHKTQLNKVTKELNLKKKEVKKLKQKEKKLQKEIAQIKQQLYKSQKRIKKLKKQAKRQEKIVTELKEQRKKTVKKVEKEEKFMQAKVKFMYRYALSTYFSQVNPTYPYILLCMQKSLTHNINQYTMLENIKDSLIINEKVGKKILSKLLKAKKREERNRKKNISKSKKKKKLLKVVKKRREEELRRIQELERTRAKLEALIAKFKKYPIKELGHIIWPVRGEVVSRFGTIVDPKLGTKLINKGIDIKAPYGSNVAAIHNGKISYEGQFLGYGKLIIVDHENGFSSLYAYLSEILVSEGDKVKQGEIIGRVGNSGLAEESILHFEIRKNGVAVDPLRWLK